MIWKLTERIRFEMLPEFWDVLLQIFSKPPESVLFMHFVCFSKVMFLVILVGGRLFCSNIFIVSHICGQSGLIGHFSFECIDWISWGTVVYIDEFNPSCVSCIFLANYNIFGLYRELFFIVWPSPCMYVCLFGIVCQFHWRILLEISCAHLCKAKNSFSSGYFFRSWPLILRYKL